MSSPLSNVCSKYSYEFKYAHKCITLELYIWINVTEVRNEENLLITRTSWTAPMRSSHQLSWIQPRAGAALPRWWLTTPSDTFSSRRNTLVSSINNIKEKNNVTVGGKKWSHKPHPDHRQCVAYTNYRLKTFFNKNRFNQVFKTDFCLLLYFTQVYCF